MRSTILSEDILCDTGFIVAIVDRDDEFHANASYFFDSTTCRFLVPISVLVEAFHILKKRNLEQSLYSVVADPGAFEVVDDQSIHLSHSVQIQIKWQNLDFVDCLLLTYALRLAENVGREMPFRIITCDGRMAGIAYSIRPDHSFHNLRETI